MSSLRRFRKLLFPSLLVVIGLSVAACSGTGAAEPEATPSAEPGPVLADLLTAPVPSLCEHDEGTLEDGVLPGIDEVDGRVTLDPALVDELKDGAEESDKAIAAKDAAGDDYLAAVMYCDQGGVAWPSRVVVWNDELQPVAVFEPEESTGGDREHVSSIEATKTGFHARWTAPNKYDASCCHQLSVEADVAVDVAGSAVTPGDVTTHRGEEQLRAVTEAALSGEKADGIETADGLYDAIAMIRDKGGKYDLDGINCIDTDDVENATIACGVPVTMDGQELAFVVRPTLNDSWNEYSLTYFDPEIW